MVRNLVVGGVGLCLCAVLACARADSEADAHTPASNTPSAPVETVGLGDGYLVWESNRSGEWRLWIRSLAFSEPRQLVGDEPDRAHCCPHVSPSGEWIAYMSLPRGSKGYGTGGTKGELRLVRRDGTDGRVLGPARTLFENRAAVWRNDQELVYVRGDGATVLRNLEGGTAEVLIPGSEGPTWLFNSDLTYGATGAADFSPFKRKRGVEERAARGGCQPYFSHDGRWGFWTAGTGGPVHRLELASGEVSTVLEKSDRRIPDGLGYVYFPMLSRDGRLFAFAASASEHDHFAADYEIFVAETDPETFEILGDAVRMTHHPKTDRFPDIYLEPLPLGRHRGEAPFEVALQAGQAPDRSKWQFDFGDGTSGEKPRHLYRTPGRYRIEARAGDLLRSGQALVLPAAPPEVVGASVRRNGREVVVRFDEEIAVESPELEFGSGRAIAEWQVGADGRSLVVKADRAFDKPDQLLVSGVSDRAQRPNEIAMTSIAIEPSRWPSDRSELAFLWETGRAENLVFHRWRRIERTVTLERSGRAQFDHNFAMVLGNGSFAAGRKDVEYLASAVKSTNQFTLEAVVHPARAQSSALGSIVSFSGGTAQSRNFALGQRGGRLVFSQRGKGGGAGGANEIRLGEVLPDQSTHVVVTYKVGSFSAYVNGEQVVDRSDLPAGFFHWKNRPLVFGSTVRGAETWAGRLEGVAMYSRFLESDEARENYERYQKKLDRRPQVERIVIDATLESVTPTPRLREISPYREALSVFVYRVEGVVDGLYEGPKVRVAQWSILDGKDLGMDRLRVGSRQRLVLEPFEANRQLESVFVADSAPDVEGELFFSIPP